MRPRRNDLSKTPGGRERFPLMMIGNEGKRKSPVASSRTHGGASIAKVRINLIDNRGGYYVAVVSSAEMRE
jgi:hypothetical protein